VDGKRNESAQIREKEDFMSAFYTTHARETHRIERQLASFARKNLPIFSPSPLQVFTHVLLSLFFHKGEREKISKKRKIQDPDTERATKDAKDLPMKPSRKWIK
jgi:hypothetical protein